MVGGIDLVNASKKLCKAKLGITKGSPDFIMLERTLNGLHESIYERGGYSLSKEEILYEAMFFIIS